MLLMRRLIAPFVLLSLLFGVEFVARDLETRLPAPLTWDNQFTQDKAEQMAGLSGESVDIVFVGSSVLQTNVDPALFAAFSDTFESGYNAAIPSATPRIWRQFTLDTAHRKMCPSTMVVGVDIRQYNDNKPGGNQQLDRYLTSRGRNVYVGEATGWERAEQWMERASALVRIRARLREPDKVVAWLRNVDRPGDWRDTSLTDEGRYRGFERRTYEQSDDRIDRLRNGAFRDLAIGGIEEQATRQIVTDALDRGIDVVLVEMPAMIAELTSALPDGEADLTRFRASLESVAGDLGVPLIRLAELNDRTELYADEYHMNLTGTETFTRVLADRLDDLTLAAGGRLCDT